MQNRTKTILIVVGLYLVSQVLILAIPRVYTAVTDASYPKLPGLEHVKKDLHHGCWAIFTDDSCWNRDYYIAYASSDQINSSLVQYLRKNGRLVTYDDQTGIITFDKTKTIIADGVDSTELSLLHDQKLTDCAANTRCTIVEVDN